MKRNSLLLLLIVAAVLAGAAVLKSSRKGGAMPADATGKPVLASLAVNDVASIEISNAENSLTLARQNDQWVLPARFGYPVDFGRIRDLIMKASDLKIGQVMRMDDRQRATLKMTAPTAGSTNSGTLVRFRDTSGKELGGLLVGESRKKRPDQSPAFFGGYPDGQYVSPDGGKTVYLVSEALFGFSPSSRDWFDAELLNIPSAEIQKVTITGTDRDPLTLQRKTDGQGLEVPDLSRKEESDEPLVSAIQSSLSFMRMDDVADPSMDDAATGMDKAIVFEATTTKGEIYKIKVGAIDPASNRYVRIEVALTPEAGMPPPPSEGSSTNQAAIVATNAAPDATAAQSERKALDDKVAALNQKMGKWTYLLASYKATPFTHSRKDLVHKKTEPKDEEQKQEEKDTKKRKKK